MKFFLQIRYFVFLIPFLLTTSSCKQQVRVKSESNPVIDGKKMTGELPPNNLNPDEALVTIQITEVTEGEAKGKVVKLEKMGHSFKRVFGRGEAISLQIKSPLALVPLDTVLCLIMNTTNDELVLLAVY